MPTATPFNEMLSANAVKSMENAIRGTDLDKISELVQTGFNLDDPYSFNLSDMLCLEFALSCGNVQSFERILELGADINKPLINSDESLFKRCAFYANNDFMVLLKKFGYKIDFNAKNNIQLLYPMCENRNIFTVNYMIENGCLKDKKNPHVTNAFIKCAGHRPLIQLFLDNGMNINTISNTGLTILAAECKNKSLSSQVEFLIKNGANIEGCHLKPTPLMNAVKAESVDNVNALLKHGANPNTIRQDKSALHLACHNNDAFLIKVLVKAGADINLGSGPSKSRTLLIDAVEFCLSRAAMAILQCEPDINRQDYQGRTALMYAISNNLKQVTSALIKKGAEIDLLTNFGETALSLAAIYDNPALLNNMLDRYGDKLTTELVQHALEVARKEKNPSTTAVLENYLLNQAVSLIESNENSKPISRMRL